MLFAAIGFVPVGYEERVALVTERVFDDGARFIGQQLSDPGFLHSLAHRRIPDPPLPGGLGGPGPHPWMRIVVESTIEQQGQPVKFERRVGHDGIGAHPERLENAFARQVVALRIGCEDLIEACIVKQSLLHGPGCGIANYFCRVAHQFDERGDSAFVVHGSERHRSPLTDPRALMSR